MPSEQLLAAIALIFGILTLILVAIRKIRYELHILRGNLRHQMVQVPGTWYTAQVVVYNLNLVD